MAPSSSTQFIDAALSCTTSPFALSYTDPNQKWIIRKHLLSLLQNYPNIIPSSNTFIHNNGVTVNLLNASGYLHISNSAPPIPLTIWVHENYPNMAPIVFIMPDPMYPIHHDHPFVDPSGATTSPYLQTWLYPKSNLSDLVHNLVKLFSLAHPFFYYSPLSSITTTHNNYPSLVSKMEAIDRLAGKIHYDLTSLRAKTRDEIEELSTMQVEMVKRVDIGTSIVIGLEHERMNLKRRVMELEEDVDVLMNWLKVHDPTSVVAIVGDGIEDVFEAVDKEMKLVLEYLAADRALEDLMYALDQAVEEGVVSFELYIRQVRVLARDQFTHRAMLLKLKGPNILHYPY